MNHVALKSSALTSALAAGLLALASPATAQVAAPQPAVDPVFAEWQPKADPAVEKALAFLQRVQKPDGSYEGQYGDSTGVPALAGMAFLSKGHLPTEGPYTTALNRIIDYILTSQKPDGLFEKGSGGSGPMYAHNISTLFLSEVSGMVDPERQKRISTALPKAVALILRAQAVKKDDNNRGGWHYHAGANDSDTSCSGWALMALRSAKLNGAAIPDSAIRDAVEYLRRHQNPKEAASAIPTKTPTGCPSPAWACCASNCAANTAASPPNSPPPGCCAISANSAAASSNNTAITTMPRRCSRSAAATGRNTPTGCMPSICRNKPPTAPGKAARPAASTAPR